MQRFRTRQSFEDAAELVSRFFSARENCRFQALEPHEQPAAFFNLWTRKEALLKATGEGITASLDQIEVSFVPGEPARFVAVAGNVERAAGWSLADISPSPGWAAAIAIPPPKA